MAGDTLFLHAREHSHHLVSLLFCHDVEQGGFLALQSSAEPVRHSAAGVSNERAGSASSHAILAEDTMYRELERHACHLSVVAFNLVLDMVPQNRLRLALFRAAQALIKAGFSRVKADHHESKPWITVIAEK